MDTYERLFYIDLSNCPELIKARDTYDEDLAAISILYGPIGASFWVGDNNDITCEAVAVESENIGDCKIDDIYDPEKKDQNRPVPKWVDYRGEDEGMGEKIHRAMDAVMEFWKSLPKTSTLYVYTLRITPHFFCPKEEEMYAGFRLRCAVKDKRQTYETHLALQEMFTAGEEKFYPDEA